MPHTGAWNATVARSLGAIVDWISRASADPPRTEDARPKYQQIQDQLNAGEVTPEQVKAEVWMSIVHGSRGIIYFCHQFRPRSAEAGLLDDEAMAQAVSGINRQVRGATRPTC